MVYDCFQFFNELDILKLRMQVMAPVVDKFVISEATETFSGMKKPLYYEENKEMFAEFADKIIHVVVDDTPAGDTHERDTFQKNAVGRGLKGCKDEDIIIFSDLDEIPNPVKVKEILADCKDGIVYHMAQRLFYCYLNMEEVSGNLLAYCGEFDGVTRKKWLGTKICRYSVAKTMPLGELRWPKCKEIGIRVEDGGWHFGYMGGSKESDVRKRVAEKVQSAAHQEYNKKSILNEVDDKIKDGEDIFGRDAKFTQVTIDNSFPEYLRTHLKEYAHLIKPDEKQYTVLVRHARRTLKKTVRNILVPIKRMVKKVIGRS